MYKSLLVSALVFFFIGCNSSKPVIRTTKKPTTTTRTVKKPATQTSRTASQQRNSGNKSNEELKATSAVKVTTEVVKQYITGYKETAKDNMRTHGIPASITLAQGILESGSGQGRLALQANNHFGIKCHTDWTGETIRHDDDAKQECFRKYRHASESFRDHSLFLTSRSRYADLFTLDKGDYKGWAKGLRKAGYATDPKYPDKLISLIERYELYKYDDEVLGNMTRVISAVPDTAPSEEVPSHRVAQGDTLYSISKKYNTTVDEIKKLNNLSGNDISIGQLLRVK